MKLDVNSNAPVAQTLVGAADAVLQRTGYFLPATLLALLVLAILYPDRLIFTNLPILGNTIHMLRHGNRGEFERFLETAKASEFGVMRYTFLGLGSNMIFNRPEYIEYIQKTNFENFEKGWPFRSRFVDLLGHTGIFVSDGPTWKTQRKLASLMFSNRSFNTHIRNVVHSELVTTLQLLDAITAKGGVGQVHMPDLFFRYTLSSFSKIAFSKDIGCLNADPAALNQKVAFSEAFDYAQGVCNRRFLNPLFQLTEKFNSEGKQMRAAIKTMRDFGMAIIEQRRQEKLDEKSASGGAGESGAEKAARLRQDGQDLLALFLEVTDDVPMLLDVVINFLIAGRDTTAQSLSWLFYELYANPQHVPIMVAEINALLGAPSSAATDGGATLLEYEQLKELPYTLACLHESIRLHPPVAKNGRVALSDDVIVPQGPNPDNLPPIKVYKGEWCSWVDHSMARLTSVWGEDAESYNPLRFLSREGGAEGKWQYNAHSQWKFHVFNGGPRLCLGMNLANYEALAFLAAALPRFQFKWSTAAEGQTAEWPPTYANSVTHPMKDDYLMTLTRTAEA